MKTEFEIASAIRNYVTSNEGVTDFPVTLRQISDEVDTLRMRTIDSIDEKGDFKRPFLNFTQIIEFDSSAIAFQVKRDVARNIRYIDVPRIYILKNGKPAISYIGGLAGTQHYRVVYGLQREWHKSDKWIGRLPTAVIIESSDVEGYRIEFINVSPNKARLVAVFEDPSDLEVYGYNGSVLPSDGGTLYPLPSAHVDILIGKTVESYLRTLYRVPLQANQQVDAPKQIKETT